MDNLKRRPDILSRQVGDEHMLYDASGRKVHVLNQTAFFIWGLCDGTLSIKDMVSRAAKGFNAAPEEVESDVAACIEELKALSLIE